MNTSVYSIILAAVCIASLVLMITINFVTMPKERQIAMLKEWLKLAVTQAERELGSGTGQLKLRYVYDLFIVKFPRLSKLISFEQFSLYVDDALIWLNSQLLNNVNIKDIVGGK